MDENGSKADHDDEYDHDHEKINRLTRLLCEANKLLDDEPRAGQFRSKEMCLWWEKHQEQDRLRLEKEALERAKVRLRIQARNKLTKEELEALGIK